MSDMRHIQTAMDNAAQFIMATWQQVVMGSMSVPGVPDIRANVNLRKAYAESIVLSEQLNIPQSGTFRRKIVAAHKIAADLEHGKAAWDMKPGLLNGPKARVNKQGKKFNVIPFRQRTPQGATANHHFSGVMPKDIHQAAKKLKQGERLTGTEKRFPALVHRFAKADGTVVDYQRKAGRYEGMSKQGSGGQAKYMTFRVVSENSDPDSWWHPGFRAHDITRGVSDFCMPIVEKSIREAAVRDMVDIPELSVAFDISVT